MSVVTSSLNSDDHVPKFKRSRYELRDPTCSSLKALSYLASVKICNISAEHEPFPFKSKERFSVKCHCLQGLFCIGDEQLL